MNARYFLLQMFSLAVAAVCISGCFGTDEESNPAGSQSGGSVAQNRVLDITYNYTASDGQMILTRDQQIELMCDGSTAQYDTIPAERDTMKYEVKADTLRAWPFYNETTNSGAEIDYVGVFCRTGSGTGLQGYWALRYVTYRVSSGTLTDAEKADAASLAAEITNEEAVKDSMEIDITGSTLSYYFPVYQSADDYIGQWEDDGNLGRMDITLKALDDTTVQLTGNVSGEIITITTFRNGDVLYTSSDPAHADHRYYDMPTECPNYDAPQWYWDFMGKNLK